MKKIISFIIMILIVFFFFIPVRKVITNCVMVTSDTAEIKYLTPFQAFMSGYLQIPSPKNNWSLRTEPNNICV